MKVHTLLKTYYETSNNTNTINAGLKVKVSLNNIKP